MNIMFFKIYNCHVSLLKNNRDVVQWMDFFMKMVH
jgi:hypothetical protein